MGIPCLVKVAIEIGNSLCIVSDLQDVAHVSMATHI
jgi:SpoU rRNA methylase family enzyme